MNIVELLLNWCFFSYKICFMAKASKIEGYQVSETSDL